MQTQAMLDLPPVVAPPPARPLMKLYPMFSMNMYAARRSGLRALRAQAPRVPCAQANESRLRPRQVPYKLCPYGGPYGGSLPFCKPTELRGFGTFCQGSRGLKWFLASPGFCGTTKVRRRARRPRQRGRA